MGEASKAQPKVIDAKELSKHTDEDDCWMAINGKVYDVSKFSDHPGGKDILVDSSGRDATKDFNDISHSSTAAEMMKDYYIGEFSIGENVDVKKKEGGFNVVMLIPIMIIILAIVASRFL
mmetsp:Transcript_23651/g.23403  ORF Transcript_23651/g.23403 Transcript_23651/m.23403 type:complete len:120 (-) Transcript_23651:47-406(-)|eukprot:CAMPEP_0202941498 /NCGR_PEP_ID=MMETSP1395-20130829/1629_1 /ASSEMBLY_ACC=CAM_ASM_000871 /TAXON_ID=5961 /ORGANISM="Blepharisma japonicum, Strain Stock R1072" /LENGTH=119 /DNA_ID=CAMNT_0049636781 /DNA_START=309 /DNA_END=668 /DNA_ORIENTATION=+